MVVDARLKKDVDILFMIDNSPSMSPKQKALASNISALIQKLEKNKLNYHIGVVSTDIGSTTAPGTTFRGVCRASDTEAWAVGTGGAIFSIGATSATREASVTTVNDFNAVDCPVVGQAVACGANSTVWRRSGGVWAAAPAFPMPGRTFTSCKLVNGAIWVAGDSVFARLDPQATTWTVLAARTGLNHLIIRAPNDIFATAAANTSNFDVVRYDGTAWSTVLSGTSGVPGGGVQVGARVVWGASAGALVEGR